MALPALGPALPEIILAIGAIVMVLVGAIQGERSMRLLEGLALALLAVALVMVVSGTGKMLTFNDGFIVDGFARFMKVLTLLGAGAAILLSADTLRRQGTMRFEFPILVVLSTIGMMMMISANDLISLYVGLELQSLALYVVAAFDRDNARSTEAGLKYFVLGALSSGMLLYGGSLVYGFTGTVTFPGIAAATAGGHAGIGLIFGIVFIAAGVAFKISAVPFHMWTPDVYEGAPTPVAAFFASAPKMAAMAMVIRVFIGAFPGAIHDWRQIIVFIAAGVAFKISAVPFHMWTPDVYEGAPTPVAAFFASAPKMAAMAMVVRIFIGAFPGALHEWQQIIIVISIASMALGAFAAIFGPAEKNAATGVGAPS